MTPKYDPRVLDIVPAPGMLYLRMSGSEIIDLPEATKN
jgi:hypothetical protein